MKATTITFFKPNSMDQVQIVNPFSAQHRREKAITNGGRLELIDKKNGFDVEQASAILERDHNRKIFQIEADMEQDKADQAIERMHARSNQSRAMNLALNREIERIKEDDDLTEEQRQVMIKNAEREIKDGLYARK